MKIAINLREKIFCLTNKSTKRGERKQTKEQKWNERLKRIRKYPRR